MSYRTAKVGEVFYDTLTVLDDNGQPISGLSNTVFTLQVARNADPVVGTTATFSEIGSTGTYVLTLPGGFPSAGTWVLTVLVSTDNSIWRSTVEVRLHDVDDVYAMVVGGVGAERVYVRYQDVRHGNALVPDLLIHVYDETGNVLVTFGRSNSSGVCTFLLDAGTYILRAFKPGVSSGDQEILVTISDETFTLDCESIMIEPPASPQLCRLYGDFLSQDGLPYAQFKLSVENLFDPAAGFAVVDRIRTYETDANGHVEFDVVRGTRVRVAFITTPFTRTFTVPDTSVASVLTLMGSATDNFQVVR